MQNYDLIIIGTGGGTKLRRATEFWKKIAIIERWPLGGTCLNRGCIPSKMLIYPADLVTHIQEDAQKLNIKLEGKISLDFEKLISRVNTEIQEDSASIQPLYEKDKNIDLYIGHAKFLENKVVEVNNIKMTAPNIYIAVGSKPQIPNISWLEGTPYFTSTEALKNTKKPKKMIVIWGGYIATELGHFYGSAGVDMHFLVRSEMLKNEDIDIRKAFQNDFQKRYTLHFWVDPIKVEYSKNTFFITVEDDLWNQKIMESDALLVATWVTPNTDNLWLENTDISLSSKGYIQVNKYLETAVSWVYALGDVVGNYLFRHSVNFEWEYLLAQHYQWEISAPIDYPPMPHAVFSYPQIASVWLTQDELEKQGKKEWVDYVISIAHYKNTAMGSAMQSDIWFVKLIVDPTSGMLLWAHIIGEKASDIIHMLIVYISEKIPIQNMLKNLIFIHPALSEVIKNAVRTWVKSFKI